MNEDFPVSNFYALFKTAKPAIMAGLVDH